MAASSPSAAHQFYDDEQGRRARRRREVVQCGVDQPGGGASTLTAFLAGAWPVGRVSLIYYRLVFLQRLDAFNPVAASPSCGNCPLVGRRFYTERSSRSIAHYISVNYWTSAAAPPSTNGRPTSSRLQTGQYIVAPHQIHSRQYAASTTSEYA